MRYFQILFLLAGCGLLLLAFEGGTRPLSAADPAPATYGTGDIEIRVYTDYFCGPCHRAEVRMEKLLTEIVKKRKARVLFIDTPIHEETVLYAKYFLYILKASPNTEIRAALKLRTALFDAAEKEIRSEDKLKAFLQERGIPFTALDPGPYFNAYSEFIKEDGIQSTPAIVVVTGNGRTAHGGADNIIKALENIRGRTSRKSSR